MKLFTSKGNATLLKYSGQATPLGDGGQAMTEYVLVLLLCIILAWVGTSVFQARFVNVYDKASSARAGATGMVP
jgi:low temperature requirement protein LtrA